VTTSRLEIDAGHPAVRIEVLDAGYQVRAKGYGRLDADLPTGFYNVRYFAADAMVEQPITLRPHEPLSLTDQPDLRFSSAAPMELTSTSHEYQQAHAKRLSAEQPLQMGSGAQLFLFIRDLDPGGSRRPAQGLTLHRADGALVLRANRVVEVCKDASAACWAGRNIELDPGVYRLRLALQRRRAVEMSVVACPGWQTQVFLLRQPGEAGERPTLDLLDATQLMAEPWKGYEPWQGVKQGRLNPAEAGEDLRLAELARRALGRGWELISTEDLGALLDGKWFDPLLGIFGLHLLLMRPEPDLDLADRVVGRIRQEILNSFRHPDVEALAVELALRRGIPIDVPPVAAPPMLRRSWEMLVRATANAPSLIAPGSLSSRIADRLWGSGAWLAWEVPPEPRRRKRRDDSAPPAIAPAPPVQQPRIEERADRVLIGGVTVFKRGVRRVSTRAVDEEPDENVTVGFALTGGEEPTRLSAPGESPATLSEQAPLQSILQNPSIAGVIRDLAGTPELRQEQLATVDYTALRTAVESILPELERQLAQRGLEQIAGQAGLDAVEAILLSQFEGVRRSQQRGQHAPTRDPLALDTLVDQLGLPANRIHSAIGGLFVKLLRVLSRRG
jgi:hypothetical protein